MANVLSWNEWYQLIDNTVFQLYGIRASSTRHNWHKWYREGFTPREAILEAIDRGLVKNDTTVQSV